MTQLFQTTVSKILKNHQKDLKAAIPQLMKLEKEVSVQKNKYTARKTVLYLLEKSHDWTNLILFINKWNDKSFAKDYITRMQNRVEEDPRPIQDQQMQEEMQRLADKYWALISPKKKIEVYQHEKQQLLDQKKTKEIAKEERQNQKDKKQLGVENKGEKIGLKSILRKTSIVSSDEEENKSRTESTPSNIARLLNRLHRTSNVNNRKQVIHQTPKTQLNKDFYFEEKEQLNAVKEERNQNIQQSAVKTYDEKYPELKQESKKKINISPIRSIDTRPIKIKNQSNDFSFSGGKIAEPTLVSSVKKTTQRKLREQFGLKPFDIQSQEISEILPEFQQFIPVETNQNKLFSQDEIKTIDLQTNSKDLLKDLYAKYSISGFAMLKHLYQIK